MKCRESQSGFLHLLRKSLSFFSSITLKSNFYGLASIHARPVHLFLPAGTDCSSYMPQETFHAIFLHACYVYLHRAQVHADNQATLTDKENYGSGTESNRTLSFSSLYDAFLFVLSFHICNV